VTDFEPAVPVPDAPPALKTLIRPAAAITAITVGVHATNLLSQVAMARLFGAGPELDAFFAAFALPQYVTAIVIGALAQICVPVLVSTAHDRGPAEAQRVAKGISMTVIGALAVLAPLCAVFASPLLHLSAPGLPPATHDAAVAMARILWPSVLGAAAVAIATSIENAAHRFVWAAVVPLLGGILNVVLLVALARPIGTRGAAVAMTASLLAQLLLFAPLLLRGRGGLRELLSLPGVREALTLLWPLLASGAFVRLTIVAERFFGSTLGAGSVAEISYASRMIGPLSLLLTAGLAAVLFPRLAHHVASGDFTELGASLSLAIRGMWVVVAPAMLVGIALARPLIAALFEGGRFTSGDSARVAALLQIYLLSLAAASLGMVTGRVLYALKASRLLSITAVVEGVAYVAYTALLARWLGPAGVAWGFVLYLTASLTWHFVVIRHRIRWTDAGATAAAVLRTTVAALFATAAAHLVAVRIAGAWLQLFAGGGVALLVFVGALVLVNRTDARRILAAAGELRRR
jgi:putative peptidoglycan lipid II flippase